MGIIKIQKDRSYEEGREKGSAPSAKYSTKTEPQNKAIVLNTSAAGDVFIWMQGEKITVAICGREIKAMGNETARRKQLMPERLRHAVHRDLDTLVRLVKMRAATAALSK